MLLRGVGAAVVAGLLHLARSAVMSGSARDVVVCDRKSRLVIGLVLPRSIISGSA